MTPLDSYERSLAEFVTSHPGYDPGEIESLRAGGYRRLDQTGHTYLDYTGGGLHSTDQLDDHFGILSRGLFGNPHSGSPTSMASTALVEEAREAVLAYSGADPAEYDVVFTQNASAAIRLVGEAFPFSEGSRYLLTYDNHNSINGVREFARRRGASIEYVPVLMPDLRIDGDQLRSALENDGGGGGRLFAYPAQSNFSGVQHSLEWVDVAQSCGWRVLLDCAAFAPTNRLDLARTKPDFVPLSFYKMFGYPTGIGALIARHEALAELERPWFAGGTITLASVQGTGRHALAPGHAGFEDGTVDYLGLPAITIGLAHLASVGIDVVHARVMALTSWLLDWMGTAAHANGAPLVRIFGPAEAVGRGSTVAFYLLDPAGAVYDVYRMEEMAGEQSISLRTGCFCNPGDGEVAHGITAQEMERCFESGSGQHASLRRCQRLISDESGKVPNTIRVSLGIASDFRDVWRFARFAEGLIDRPASDIVHVIPSIEQERS